MGIWLRTNRDGTAPSHPTISIVGQNTLYCGQSNCTGDGCNYPALMLTHPTQGEFKAHSDMVAVGRMFQKKTWNGPKVQLTDLYPDLTVEALDQALDAMWW